MTECVVQAMVSRTLSILGWSHSGSPPPPLLLPPPPPLPEPGADSALAGSIREPSGMTSSVNLTGHPLGLVMSTASTSGRVAASPAPYTCSVRSNTREPARTSACMLRQG